MRDFKRTGGDPEEQEKRKKSRTEAKKRWFDAAGRQGPAAGRMRSGSGTRRPASWMNSPSGTWSAYVPREEIAELRNAKVRALRTNWDLRHEAARVARRDVRRSIRRAKKNCWDNFLENASGEDVWTAVRYTNPKLDGSAKPLINGKRTAVTRDDKEQVILATAFPDLPPDNGIKAPQGGAAHRAVNRALVGSILAGCSNQSAPGEDRMGAEVVKLLWEPHHQPGQVVHPTRHSPQDVEDGQRGGYPEARQPDYRQVRAYRVIALLTPSASLSKTQPHT